MERPVFFLRSNPHTVKYTKDGKPVKSKVPERDRQRHAAELLKQYESAISNSTEENQPRNRGDGAYVEFSSSKNEALETSGLESLPSKIRLLNVREGAGITEATVFIPTGKETILANKLQKYADPEKDGKSGPANNKLCAGIEKIQPATAESLWTGRPERFPQEKKQWLEIWIRTDGLTKENEESFRTLAKELSIELRPNSISFPERTVLLAHANKGDLTALFGVSTILAELREASAAASFFNELSAKEANEWIEDLLFRTKFTSGKSVVCILDSGVSVEHPLLRYSINKNAAQSALGNIGPEDRDGHGTSLAGIVLYDDLKEKLTSQERYEITHRFETFKIFQNGRIENEGPQDTLQLYGDIAAQAISRAEIANQEANRIICSAVTSTPDEQIDGKPSSWSGAIDEIIANSDGDEARLFLVSAGNINPQEYEGEYPDGNTLRSVRSPGQAWNALTVGAFCDLDTIQSEDYLESGYAPTASAGQLAPFSTTSLSWDKTWPIKPEVVCAGGNTASKGTEQITCPDLSRVSTGSQFLTSPLSSINATSAAVAQAAWIASEIENAYPDAWPETVRGLIVHSARWTDKMREQFCPDDSTKAKRRNLVRACGYGIPDAKRAIECAQNSVNLVIQGELQPFCYEDGDKTKDMHFHKIPWPKSILRDLGGTEATLRVTLSYFIEPSPGGIGWKDKYTYQSHGLRFDVNSSDETMEDFARRVTTSVQDEDNKQSLSGSGNWYLGDTICKNGSIRSDWKSLNAIDLSEVEFVAVYPVNGWWRKRPHLDKINSVARYSLIVSIETPASDVDLYTAVKNIVEIENLSCVPIPVG